MDMGQDLTFAVDGMMATINLVELNVKLCKYSQPSFLMPTNGDDDHVA